MFKHLLTETVFVTFRCKKGISDPYENGCNKKQCSCKNKSRGEHFMYRGFYISRPKPSPLRFVTVFVFCNKKPLSVTFLQHFPQHGPKTHRIDRYSIFSCAYVVTLTVTRSSILASCLQNYPQKAGTQIAVTQLSTKLWITRDFGRNCG